MSNEKLKQELTNRLQSRLRVLFDTAISNETASACIDIANDLKWDELAKEMQSDMLEVLTEDKG